MLRFLGTLIAFFAVAACATNKTNRETQTISILPTQSGRSLTLGPTTRGSFEFPFRTVSGEEIPVFAYIPQQGEIELAPIVIVMHGAGRDADRYRDQWVDVADTHGLIIIAPTFDKERFPKSANYNLGRVFNADTGAMNDESRWVFSSIEPLFRAVRASLDSQRDQFFLYGHSAGSQFVHRYLYYVPDAPVALAIAANAGWYTMPDTDESYPYGLKKSGLGQSDICRVVGQPVVVLLGTDDIDTQGRNLRRTPEALRQGPHRYARGKAFYARANDEAAKCSRNLAWQQINVPGVGHSNGGMAPAAGQAIASYIGETEKNVSK